MITAAIIVAILIFTIVRAGSEAEQIARAPNHPTARELRRKRRQWRKERLDLNPAQRRR